MTLQNDVETSIVQRNFQLIWVLEELNLRLSRSYPTLVPLEATQLWLETNERKETEKALRFIFSIVRLKVEYGSDWMLKAERDYGEVGRQAPKETWWVD